MSDKDILVLAAKAKEKKNRLRSTFPWRTTERFGIKLLTGDERGQIVDMLLTHPSLVHRTRSGVD